MKITLMIALGMIFVLAGTVSFIVAIAMMSGGFMSEGGYLSTFLIAPLVIFLSFVLWVFGAIFFIAEAVSHAKMPKVTLPKMSSPLWKETKEHTIEKETVKIRCRHCGALNIETQNFCANCGAKL